MVRSYSNQTSNTKPSSCYFINKHLLNDRFMGNSQPTIMIRALRNCAFKASINHHAACCTHITFPFCLPTSSADCCSRRRRLIDSCSLWESVEKISSDCAHKCCWFSTNGAKVLPPFVQKPKRFCALIKLDFGTTYILILLMLLHANLMSRGRPIYLFGRRTTSTKLRRAEKCCEPTLAIWRRVEPV